MRIPNGAEICPYCRSHVNGFGGFGDLYDRFNEGYQEGRSGKNMELGIVALIIVALYFIQKWTGLPIMDWIEDAFSWIFHKLVDLLPSSS